MPRFAQQPVGVGLHHVLPEAKVFGDRQVYATSCTVDPAQVRQGDIFFAVSNENGAADATLAAQRGAKAIVTDSYLPVFTTPQYVVPDAKLAHSQFCQQMLGEPSHDLALAAVAGAHGKTTISRLLTGILRHTGRTTGCLADGMKSDGAYKTQPAEGATTSAGYTARWMSECVARGASHAVVEASSQTLATGVLSGARLAMVCLSSLQYEAGQPHSPKRQARLISDLVARLRPFTTLVLDADDPIAVQTASYRKGLELSYGMQNDADVRGVCLPGGCSQVLLVTHGADTMAVDLRWPGEAMARNALAAIASAIALGVSLQDACLGVQANLTLPAVLQSVSAGQSFNVLMDQAVTPHRLEASLQAARQTSTGRVVVVLPEQASDADRLIATELADEVILPAGQVPESGDNDITRVVEDRFAALALAIALAETGETVLLTGSPAKATELKAETTVVKGLIELRLANTKEPQPTT